MAIKYFITILVICIGPLVFAQGTETQRKYNVPDSVTTDMIMALQNDISSGLRTYFHDTYVYYDLYLDDNWLLYKNGLSLRFRKRVQNDTIVSYAFQLKTEMKSKYDVRIEVEETELDFYTIKKGNDQIAISSILDHVFTIYEDEAKTSELEEDLELLRKWIFIKAEAPIAPFQKLRFINAELFNKDVISSLTPVFCGRSFRSRGHVYVDRNEPSKFQGISFNKVKWDELPLLFKENRNYNWLLETSMDNAEFIYLEDRSMHFTIREYEVENKYEDEMQGTEVLDAYESALTSGLNMSFVSPSKYAQSVEQLLISQLKK